MPPKKENESPKLHIFGQFSNFPALFPSFWAMPKPKWFVFFLSSRILGRRPEKPLSPKNLFGLFLTFRVISILQGYF